MVPLAQAQPAGMQAAFGKDAGTLSPAYSRELEQTFALSGDTTSKRRSPAHKPAEAGQLVAMLAGDADAIANVRPLLTPMCRETMICEPIPNALLMKLSVTCT